MFWASIIAAVFGLLVGVGGVLAFRYSERRRDDEIDVDEPGLPDGAAEVLSVVGKAYIVVDTIDGVVKASPAAYAFGLVRGHTILHQELLDLIAKVRRDSVIEEKTLELPRGPLGQGTIILNVRVAAISEEYILLLADDRTDMVRTEAMRNDFVANVSHELKTPVGAISLLAEALDDAAEDEEAVRRFATRMNKEAIRLAALVQDIIELSRLQGSDVMRGGGPINLDGVIAEAVDRNKLTAESKNMSIRVGGTVPEPIYGDRDLLMTAFRNLIDNAIRYSPDGATVGVGLSAKDGVARVSVTDQGPGISPEDQERIFERFYRIDAARSRQTGGTGLGLSIVKHVISNHGGDVSVWSQLGRGSTFTVRLPLIDTEDSPSMMNDGDTHQPADGTVGAATLGETPTASSLSEARATSRAEKNS